MKSTGCGKWKQPVKGKKSDIDLTEKRLTPDHNHFLPTQDMKFMQIDGLERWLAHVLNIEPSSK